MLLFILFDFGPACTTTYIHTLGERLPCQQVVVVVGVGGNDDDDDDDDNNNNIKNNNNNNNNNIKVHNKNYCIAV